MASIELTNFLMQVKQELQENDFYDIFEWVEYKHLSQAAKLELSELLLDLYPDFLKDLTRIYSSMFKYSSIKSIELPDTITTIEPAAFAYSALEEITIHKSVEQIAFTAFKNCFNLRKLYTEADSFAETAFRTDDNFPNVEIVTIKG